MHKLRFYMLLIAGLLVSACSTTTALYNNVDFIAGFYIDDYVDLDSRQKKILNARIKKWHAWHRSNELSKYKIDLIALKENLQTDPLDKEQWLVEYSKAQSHLIRLRDEISPEAIELIQQLSDQQIAGLLESWSENDLEEIDQFTKQGVEGERKARQSKTEKMVEKYIGQLSVSQERIIRYYSMQTESTFFEEMDYNKKLRAAVGQLLLNRNNSEFPAKFSALINNLDALKPPTLLAAQQQNKYKHAELLSELNASLDKDQKTSLLLNIELHIETIDDLIN